MTATTRRAALVAALVVLSFARSAVAELLDTLPQTRNSPLIAVPERVKADPHSGGASYAYPIEIPSGTGGLTPQLQLQYSSLTKNTEYGYGWKLNMSRIERCTRFGPPKYVFADDQFELDGEVLVRDPADANRFYQRAYDGARVTYEPGADAWEVTRPDGTRLRYGSTPDSKLTTGGAGSGPSFRWSLAEVVDPLGNSYRIEYEPDLEDHDDDGTADYAVFNYPRRIRYSFHVSLPESHTQAARLIELLWSDRGGAGEERDRPTSYRFGAKVQINKRLAEIRVGIDTTAPSGTVDPADQVRRYELIYAAKFSESNPDGPPFSVLAAVQRHGSDDTAFSSKTDFDYTTHQIEGGCDWFFCETGPDWTHFGSGFGGPLRTTLWGDERTGLYEMNGDGLVDRLHVTDIADGSRWQVKFATRIEDPEDPGNEWGLTAFQDWGWNCQSEPPTCQYWGSMPSPKYDDIRRHEGASDGWHSNRWELADLDGDGRPDLVESGPWSYWRVYRNLGFGFAPADTVTWQKPALGAGFASQQFRPSAFRVGGADSNGKAQLIDVNGDGRPDHVASLNSDPSHPRVSVNTGAGFEPPVTVEGPFGLSGNHNLNHSLHWDASLWEKRGLDQTGTPNRFPFGMRRSVADVNGDGLPDVVTLSTTNHDSASATCYDIAFGLGATDSGGSSHAQTWQSAGGAGHAKADTHFCRPSGSLAPERHQLLPQPPGCGPSPNPLPCSDENLTDATFVDMNADGVVDALHRAAIEPDGTRPIRVHFGLGDGSFTAHGLPFGFRLREAGSQADFGFTHQDLMDMDGDGMPELLFVNTSSKIARHPAPPGLLTHVTNELGGTMEIAYQASSDLVSAAPTSESRPYGSETLPASSVRARSNAWVVASIRTRDGRSGTGWRTISGAPAPGTSDQSETLTYAEFRYENELRESLGARMAESTDAEGTVTRALFHQALELRGRPDLEEVVDAAGRLFRSREVSWTALLHPAFAGAAPGDPTASLVAPVQERKTLYDPDAPGFDPADPATRQDHIVYQTFDPLYANLLTRGELGTWWSSAGDPPLDQYVLREEFDYLPNATDWLVSHPVEARQVRPDGTIVGLTRTFYDDAEAQPAAPTLGLITKKLVEARRSATEVDQLIERWDYDADGPGATFGNLTRYWAPNLSSLPLGAPTDLVEYETTYNTFVETWENASTSRTRYEIDPGFGEVDKLLDPQGYLRCWNYDVFGRLLGRHDKADAATAIGDSCDRQLASFDFVDLGLPDGTSPDRQHILATTWADAAQSLQSYRYLDGLGRVYHQASEGRDGVVDDFVLTRREWDARGELLCEWLPDEGPAAPVALPDDYAGCPDPSAGPPETRRTFSYDPLLRQTRVLHGTTVEVDIDYSIADHDGLAGNELLQTHTVHGQPDLIRRVGLDNVGAPVSACEQDGAECAMTFIRRDAKRRITLIDGPDLEEEATSIDPNLLGLEYDTADRRIRLTRGEGAGARTWEFFHDLNGNVASVVSPRAALDASYRVDLYYDGLDRLVLRDRSPFNGPAAPGAEDARFTFYGQDEGTNTDRLQRIDTPDLSSLYAWDLRGVSPAVVRAYPEGVFGTQTEVDLLERPTVVHYGDGDQLEIDYDGDVPSLVKLVRPDESELLLFDQIDVHPSGALQTVRHIQGDVTTTNFFELADAFRLSGSRSQAPGATPLLELGYEYDPAGNLLCITPNPTSTDCTGSVEQSFTYDARHRLDQADDHGRAGGYGVLDYDYDDLGNLVLKGPHELLYGETPNAGPDGVTSVLFNAHNPDPAAPDLDEPCGPGWVVQDPTDSNGDGIPNECQCGDTNDDGHVTAVDAFNIVNCMADPNCPAAPVDPDLWDTNNDGFVVSVDAFNISSAVASQTFFQLSCANRPSGQPLYELYTYDYNEDGQVRERNLGASNAQTYTWHPEGRLETISGSVTATYAYDHDGRRVRKGDETLFIERNYEVDLANGKHRKHVFLEGRRLLTVTRDGLGTAQEPGDPATETQVQYFANQVNSQRVTADASGAVLHRAILDPYGGLTSLQDATGAPLAWSQLASDYLFSDHHYEQESGLHFMGARYYDPLTARFLSTDPALIHALPRAGFTRIPGLPQAQNAYAYALGNPVKYVDASGEIVVLPVIIGAIWVADKALTAYDTYQDYQAIQSGEKTIGEVATERAIETAAGAVIPGGKIATKLLKKLDDVAAPIVRELKDSAENLAQPKRRPQDAGVNPNAPKRLSTDRPIGRSDAQNARKDEIVEQMKDEGYRDIRVDQQQVNAAGERVGVNRPDIQGTSPDGRRVNVEIDRRSSNRGPGHKERILANDPTADVLLETVD